uniref:Uncharacterized protein n=1 Tax=Oryza nivara TaxID=4536 RepID=A0A0E0H2V9_ORYNI
MNSAAETETEGGGGAAAVEPQVVVVERVVTVEYLEPSMSRGLLGMFPDSSAFDFDYSQSGIWSPLNKVPRASSPPPPPPRSGGGGAEGSRDFLIANPKRRARAAIGGRSSRSRRRRLRLRREDGSFLNLHETGCARLDFSPPPPSSPLPAKVAFCIQIPPSLRFMNRLRHYDEASAGWILQEEGWRRVLKAAIRKFKSRQRRSRPAPLLQMMLPTL